MNGIRKNSDAWLDAQFAKIQASPAGDPKAQQNSNKPVMVGKTVKIPTGPTNGDLLEVKTAKSTSRTQPTQDRAATPASYNDDFENYDEDFEDFDNSVPPSPSVRPMSVPAAPSFGKLEKSEATRDESDSLESPQISDESLSNPIRTNSISTSAYVTQKMMRRFKELSDMIALDVAIFNIFDMAPLNEYEQYIRDFGASNTVQAATQCNEDACEQELQTEDYFMEDKWTQAPPEELRDSGSGPPPSIPSLKEEAAAWEKSERRARAAKMRVGGDAGFDSLSLARFLKTAGQVVDVLLEENTLGLTERNDLEESRNIRISHGMLSLALPSAFGQRKIVSLSFSQIDYRVLIVSWGTPDEKKDTIDTKGIITIFRVTDSRTPQRVLICDSEVTHCSLIPQFPHIVIAGTLDGGVVVWDLRDNIDTKTAGLYPVLEKQRIAYTLQCYSVDALYGLDQVHCGPIVGLLHLSRQRGSENTHGQSKDNVDDDASFEEVDTIFYATVDENGRAERWSVNEMTEAEARKYCDTDYGLNFGGKLKIVRSGSFDVLKRQVSVAVIKTSKNDHESFEVRVVQIDPNNSDRLLVGTDNGLIFNSSRTRRHYHPREFRESRAQTFDCVNSISFSPHGCNAFLAGYKSGMIALFDTGQEYPLKTWCIENCNGIGGVRQVWWSEHRPAVFFALDAKDNVHVWDLLEQEALPTYVVGFGDRHGAEARKRRVVSVAQSPAFGSESYGDAAGSAASLASSATRNAVMAVGFMSGEVEVHYLIGELVETGVDEGDGLRQWLAGQLQQQAG
ncbi:hypothetical protein HDU84_007642 [Entophlyctis sp. JEL0112]|nr:hypothetical protein HDU84_007642 [Entophlyctis sp. JEL0112]